MTDDEIAIAHIVLIDAQTVEDARFWRDRRLAHWESMKHGEHCGDCTEQAMTCRRCLADEALAMVPVYRELFHMPEPDQ